MPSTDIDGSPILILSHAEAVTVKELCDYRGPKFGDEFALARKVIAFLEETKHVPPPS